MLFLSKIMIDHQSASDEEGVLSKFVMRTNQFDFTSVYELPSDIQDVQASTLALTDLQSIVTFESPALHTKYVLQQLPAALPDLLFSFIYVINYNMYQRIDVNSRADYNDEEGRKTVQIKNNHHEMCKDSVWTIFSKRVTNSAQQVEIVISVASTRP